MRTAPGTSAMDKRILIHLVGNWVLMSLLVQNQNPPRWTWMIPFALRPEMLTSVSVLWRKKTSGFSQPAPTDHIPLTGETLPGFSQLASTDLTTTQHAPILQPVVIPQPQLRHEELIRVRRNLAEQDRNRLTLHSELISLKRSSESGLENLTPQP